MRILTFDIEDWFHLLDHAETESIESWAGFESRLARNLDIILELLDSRDITATFFCLGWVTERWPREIQRIADAGHELGSHSYAHGLLYRQSRAAYEEDLRRSLHVLADVTGHTVRCYRAPGFSLTPATIWAFALLIENGIELDCSIFPAARSHGGFETFGAAEPTRILVGGAEIKEFPINVLRVLWHNLVFTGGGYFRLMPYTAIAALMRRSPYAMTYFHPRDFDPDQPLLPGLSVKRRFMSYVGLSGARRKLERLLDAFSFMSLGEADAAVDWTQVRRIPVEVLAGSAAGHAPRASQ